MKGPETIYFDAQATLPVDPDVFKVMEPYFCASFGNPQSVSHRYGWEAEAAVQAARKKVAAVIGAEPEEVIFTSGATESNNMILKGFARGHVIVPETEHKSVLEVCRYLETIGVEVSYLPVRTDGLLDPQIIEKAIRKDTSLISVMAVNNEIGVIQPLKEIGQICRKRGVLFHSDAAQAFGKIELDVQGTGIDFLSVSGHKIYGPKGVGVAYIRRDLQEKMLPLMHGGEQEFGLRSGTLPVPLIVGLGAAAEKATKVMQADYEKVKTYFDYFFHDFVEPLGSVSLNGSDKYRYPGNINVTLDGVDSALLMSDLKMFAFSSGSACISYGKESAVLKALGLSSKQIRETIRIGFSRFTTQEEVRSFVKKLKEKLDQLHGNNV